MRAQRGGGKAFLSMGRRWLSRPSGAVEAHIRLARADCVGAGRSARGGGLVGGGSSQRNAGADQQHGKIAHGPVLKLLDTIILCCYEHLVLMVAGLVALNDSER